MAYTQAQVVQEDPPLADGRVHLVVQFTGDAGEPPVRLDRYLDAESTQNGERVWVRDELARLNGRKSIADQVSVGQFIIPAAAPTPPTQAEQDAALWFRKLQRLFGQREAVAAGALPAGAADALATELLGLYNALTPARKTAYLDAF